MAPLIKCKACGDYKLAWTFIGVDDKCGDCVKEEMLDLRCRLNTSERKREDAYTAGDRAGYERGMRDAAGIVARQAATFRDINSYISHELEALATLCLATIPKDQNLSPFPVEFGKAVAGILDGDAPTTEAECCEWKATTYKTPEGEAAYQLSCGESDTLDTDWKHCPYCGKPIKIKA